MAFKTIQVSDDDLQKVQQNVQDYTKSIQNNPYNKPSLITNISFSAGANTVSHLLPNRPKTWEIMGIYGAYSRFYEDKSKRTDTTVCIYSENACVADIMFI